ncbi:MAG: hypothetical protein ACTSRE_04775 [Promethearchaeota archaeon]
MPEKMSKSEFHEKMGKDLFNKNWDLIVKEDRTLKKIKNTFLVKLLRLINRVNSIPNI